MEAMANLGRSSQLGSSFSSPYNRSGLFSSGQSASPVSVTYRANGMKNAFASRAKLARQTDPKVATERPELVPRFTSIIKDDAHRIDETIVAMYRTGASITSAIVNELTKGQIKQKTLVLYLSAATDGVEETWGIQIAIAVLKFYKREISQLLPGSCRYVPTCSEYSMQAYRTYGVLKGTILTAWRIARCNPFGGSGFDPPRWFGETKPPPL